MTEPNQGAGDRAERRAGDVPDAGAEREPVLLLVPRPRIPSHPLFDPDAGCGVCDAEDAREELAELVELENAPDIPDDDPGPDDPAAIEPEPDVPDPAEEPGDLDPPDEEPGDPPVG